MGLYPQVSEDKTLERTRREMREIQDSRVLSGGEGFCVPPKNDLALEIISTSKAQVRPQPCMNSNGIASDRSERL